ncbi:hypothetical protein EG68_05466 [Paragonimus skrjabini miyazakii]|uniref:Uncharacterized protein n=1 Tax=Paragonimus skrjabini miyazakii TaxID=59628 RepID=A0A8S9YSP7_9TREM|nr:hypothetical protein EG68_05466 [Paragonimus skrjabini miyazakii]
MTVTVSHIIFDVDGLLLDTETVYTAVSSKILESYGLKLTYETKRKLMGRKPHDAAAVLVRHLAAPFTPEEWMASFNAHLTADRWHAVACLPGAERLVLHLAKHNIPMAAATGCCSHELEQKMTNHQNIWRTINHAVASGDDPNTFADDEEMEKLEEQIRKSWPDNARQIKYGKPKPDIFLAAASRFPTPPVNMELVLVFEDSPLGVEAAVAAGMHVVWVPPPEEPPSDAPETIPASCVSRVTRLRSLLDFKPEQFGIPPFD